MPAPSVAVSTGVAVQVCTVSTPIGSLTLLAREGIVLAGGFTEDLARLVVGRLRHALRDAPFEAADHLGSITDALADYFAGELAALDRVPIMYDGAPFQRRVWAALRSVPPGQPTSYRDLAVQLGGERLARAVGMGCATNPISPIIPCHRLTHSTGHLAGYAWGLDRKRWLLDHERRHAQR
jgi:methylated-DNA-[protein]-cysteine S-methyltransferase